MNEFNRITVDITQCVLPIISFIGILGNTIDVIVLSRRSLYQYACTRYFFALALNNLLYSTFVIPYRLLSDGFEYDLANLSIISCKIMYYFANVCSSLSPQLLVLASIDRYWISSANVNRRQLSNIRMARYLISILIAFFCLYYLSVPILVDTQSEDKLGCRIRPYTIYHQIHVISQLVLFAVVAPFLMTVFGLLTIYNCQYARIRARIINRRRRTETELIRVLLMQVGVHILLTVPACIISMLLLLPGLVSSPALLAILLILLRIPLHLSYTTNSILYFSTGRLYRRELLRLVRKGWNLFKVHRIHPMNTP